MKARIKPYLSAKEQKALEVEIHRQCVEATAEYEIQEGNKQVKCR